jgi:hypothetical protein
MHPPNTQYLFNRGDLRSHLVAFKQQLVTEVDGLGEGYLLRANVSELCGYFRDKYSLEAPTLTDQEPEVIDRREIKLATTGYERIPFADDFGPHYPATEIVFSITFTGEPKLFECMPSSFGANPPHGEIRGQELLVSLVRLAESPEQLRAEFDRNLAIVRQYLGWLGAEVSSFNMDIANVARQKIEERRAKVLKDQDFVKSLGFPLRQRSDESASYAVPQVRRRIAPTLATTTNEGPAPEPALEIKDYDDILKTLHHMAIVMERSPSAFTGLNEEAIRWLFLIPLNGLYEGQATGETFNFSGKTDILIRINDKNIFVAECAIWRGPVYLSQKIDQLLGYATWRDSKLALLIFNKERQFTKMLARIGEVLKQHPDFKRELPRALETEFRCVLAHRDDPERELTLTVCAFEVPA